MFAPKIGLTDRELLDLMDDMDTERRSGERERCCLRRESRERDRCSRLLRELLLRSRERERDGEYLSSESEEDDLLFRASLTTGAGECLRSFLREAVWSGGAAAAEISGIAGADGLVGAAVAEAVVVSVAVWMPGPVTGGATGAVDWSGSGNLLSEAEEEDMICGEMTS